MPAPIREHEDDPRGLFGKIFTFDEWCVAKEEEKRKEEEEKASKMGEKLAAMFGAGVDRPAHWPPDTNLDPATWVSWIPEGWGQGIKMTETGKPLKCYIGPPGSDPKTGYGKRYFHKNKIEEFCGYEFDSGLKTKKESEDTEKTVKSCHDVVPNWPGEGDKDSEFVLPRDWCLVMRQLPTGTHRCYMPPGVKDGFLWHRACCELWLKGEKKSLSSMGDSTKMANKMAISSAEWARKRDEDGLRSSKRRRTGPAHNATATDESYVRCPRLVACRMDVLEEAGCPAEEVAVLKKRAELFRELLEKRGFEDLDFMAVVLRAGEDEGDTSEAGEGKRPDGKVVSRLLGVFYSMQPGASGERRSYQQVIEAPNTTAGLFGTGLYLFWSPSRSAWKLSGSLNDSRAGYAIFPCEKDDQSTTLVPSEARAWSVLKQSFYLPESGPAGEA